MGILIEGMEIPEKQLYVILNSNGLVEVLDANNVLLEEYQAVPVPPHGRLIDADAPNQKGVFKMRFVLLVLLVLCLIAIKEMHDYDDKW